MASVYALRLFIRAMHNRVGTERRLARDHACATALVLVPLVAVIVFLALYPQLALHRSEGSVKTAVAAQALAADPHAQLHLRRHGSRAALARPRRAARHDRAPARHRHT